MPPKNSTRAPDLLDHALSLGSCAICQRATATTIISNPDLADLEDNHIAQRQWPVCASCDEAVWREVQRAALATPVRIPVAMALVASERSPLAHPPIWTARYWERLDPATQDRLVIRATILFCFWPIVVFLGVVALTVPH
jgi:hypothetical protein